MTFTEAWLSAVVAKPGYAVVGAPPAQTAPGVPALLRTPPARPAYWPYRSHLEQDYATLLERWHSQGLIRQWQYESHRLTLAPKTTLTVDFYLWMADGSAQLHEIKGNWYREDGWQKLKQAAARFPGYRFFRVQRTDAAWVWQEVPAV